MTLFNKLKTGFSSYRKDTQGNFTIMAGVMMSAMLIASGATYDYSQASKAKSYAQLAADNMALAASVAVDFDNDDRYVEGQEYSFSEIGGPANDFTNTIVGSVEYDVVDQDGETLIARATVTGTYTPAFANIIGINEVEFKAVSDVAYAARKGKPASIFFVADNSGSMGYRDDDGIVKITSLENSMKNFMTKLEVLDNDGVDDIFRTALYPYTANPNGHGNSISRDGVVRPHVVNPQWGPLSNGYINRMHARNGTDSSGALQRAADDFEGEQAEHVDVNEEEDPLKFLVFMTDGSNNETYECTTQEVWVENETAEYWWKVRRNGNIRTRYREPRNPGNWTYVPAESDGTGYYEEQETCEWDYHFDVRSLEACDQMKDAGVLIYAIAYDVEQSQRAHAEEFMQNCSSGDAFFKTAGDATALAAAFDQINDSIIDEVIRLKR